MSEGCLGVQVVFGWCVVVSWGCLGVSKGCLGVSRGVWEMSGASCGVCVGVLVVF